MRQIEEVPQCNTAMKVFDSADAEDSYVVCLRTADGWLPVANFPARLQSDARMTARLYWARAGARFYASTG